MGGCRNTVRGSCKEVKFYLRSSWDCPGSPVVKDSTFQCRGLQV